MGIDVNGKYESFKDSLEAKGFVYTNSYETLHTFYGKFANEIVTLNVLASPKTKTVCKVYVLFPIKKEWKALKQEYFTKKEMYKSKYQMDKDYEFFLYPYEDGDGYEYRAVKSDKCRFISFFYAMDGHVTVEICKSAQVKIVYEDRENIKLAKNELEQTALDDI